MIKKDNNKKGFTILELSLAVVFLSVLLLTIAWLTIHITSTYEKGLTMKAINSSGKEIIDDIQRSIASAPARTVSSLCAQKYTYHTDPYYKCVSDKARKFSYQQRYSVVHIKATNKDKILPVSGAFCTGRYSYIWNTAYSLNTTDYSNAPRASYNGNNNFRLLKVTDYSRTICSQHLHSNYYLYDGGSNYTYAGDNLVNRDGEVEHISVYDNNDANLFTNVDLLSSSENDIALYDLVVFAPTIHDYTSAGFFSGTFILATLRGGVDITSSGNFCTDPPDNLNTDFTYCAINKFNFAARAAGEAMRNE